MDQNSTFVHFFVTAKPRIALGEFPEGEGGKGRFATFSTLFLGGSPASFDGSGGEARAIFDRI